MGYDLLTVLVMSAEMVRVFSECAVTLQRRNMFIQMLEELQLRRSWLRTADKSEDYTVSSYLILIYTDYS